MRLSTAVVSFLTVLKGSVALSAAEDLLASIPKCAAECFAQTIPTSSCDATDIPCLCTDTSFLEAAQGCQALNCTVKETLTTTNATMSACGIPERSLANTVIGVTASFGPLALVLVLIRILGRLFVVRIPLGWDDYLVILAVICGTAANVSIIWMSKTGFGTDIWTIPFPKVITTLKLVYVGEVFYMISEMFVQLSILAFYLRVFPEASDFVRKSSWAMVAVAIGFGIANTVVMIFQCKPISFFWNGWAGETTGTCLNINLYAWIRSSIEILIDIIIMVLPLPSIWKLQMHMRDKLQVLLMFALGFTITIVSILRLQSLVQWAATSNLTYDQSSCAYWSTAEQNIFIISACLPAVRSVLSKLAPGVFSSNRSKAYPSGQRYHRHEDPRDTTSRSTGQFPLKEFGSSTIVKSIDVNVSSGERNDSDENLFHPTGRHNIYGA